MLHYVGGIAAFGAGSSGQDAWGVGPAGESFGIASGGRQPAPKAERPTSVGFPLEPGGHGHGARCTSSPDPDRQCN